MANAQFYTGIAIPSILVISSWLQQDRRLARIETQIETLTSDYRNFYGMEQKLEGRVDELSKRIA